MANKKFSFSIHCKKEEYDSLKKLLEKYFSKQEIEENDFKINLIETFDLNIPESIECNLCKQAIGKEDITYSCQECKIFFCHSCVKSKKSGKGFEALVHREHYLIVFQNPTAENVKNLDKYKLGKNLYASYKEEDLNQNHPFGCNGCSSSDQSERYVCLNCRPGKIWGGGCSDFCKNCFELEFEKGEIPKNDPAHKKGHVLLQMIYTGENYYTY